MTTGKEHMKRYSKEKVWTLERESIGMGECIYIIKRAGIKFGLSEDYTLGSLMVAALNRDEDR